MGMYYSLGIPAWKVLSEETVKDSSRHQSFHWIGLSKEFTASAGSIFFVQEALRNAGIVTDVVSEDWSEGGNYSVLSLKDILQRLKTECPDTPVTLVIGEAGFSSCIHKEPCGSYPTSHLCGWTETSPVDKDICTVCPYFKGDAADIKSALTKWAAIKCGHPEAWCNLIV